jgi:hypothetical protein
VTLKVYAQNKKNTTTKAHFTLGVKANAQLKSSIPIGAKVGIRLMGFTLGVKDEIEKTFSICLKLLINAELYGLVLPPRLKKKDIVEFGKPICNSWVQTTTQKCSKLSPSFFSLDS